MKIKEIDEDDDQSKENANKETEEGVMRLVDVQDNQYTMSKGKDTTIPHEDHLLIKVASYHNQNTRKWSSFNAKCFINNLVSN